jgi:hypothetical protein
MIWRERKNQSSEENIEHANNVIINDILTTSMNSNNLSNIGKLTEDCIDPDNKREASYEIFSLDSLERDRSRHHYNENQENYPLTQTASRDIIEKSTKVQNSLSCINEILSEKSKS